MKILHGFCILAAAVAGVMIGKSISTATPAGPAEETPSYAFPTAARQSQASAPDPNAIRRLWEMHDSEGGLALLLPMDPESAYELLLGFPGGNVQEWLAKLLEEHDPESGALLLRVFLRHPLHHHDFGIASTVFRHAALGDPALVWREAQARATSFLPAMLPALAQGMTRNNPLKAVAQASAIRSPAMKDTFLREVIEEWSGQDAKGLLTWLRVHPEKEKLVRQVKWSRMRISSASDLAEIAALIPAEAIAAGQDSRLFFDEQPDDLWIHRTDWLLALPPGPARESLCEVAASSLVSIDPEAALSLLPAVTQPGIRRQVLSAVAGFRAAVAPEDGLAFADTLSDARERSAARNAVFFTWAENDPRTAARHALKSGDPDARIMLGSVGHHWAAKDPEGAALFAIENDLPQDNKPPSVFSGMLDSAVRTWAGREPMTAATWAKTLPRGPQRDRAAAAIANGVSFRFPEEAMIWAQDIADESSRRQTLKLCFGTWLRRQPEQAAQWLQTNTLDDPIRQQLSQALEARRQNPSSGSISNLSDGTFITY
jgi:hypothetical protein